MTKEFILSQIAYYTKHLLSGNFHDRNMIVGLKHAYPLDTHSY